MMGLARAAIALLLFLLVLPLIFEVFPGFFRDVVPGEPVSTGMSVVWVILFLLFLIGLASRLGRRLKHGDSREREAARRRERVAPRYRAEDAPIVAAPASSAPDPDPTFDLPGYRP